MDLRFSPFPVMQTERLSLRPITVNDELSVFLLRSDEEVNRYIDRPKAETVEDARKHIRWLQECMNKNKLIIWGMNKNPDPRLIGTICLWNISFSEKTAELGFELLPGYQGEGLMYEACKAAIDYAFTQLQMLILTAWINKNNRRSISLVEKLGFDKDHAEEQKTGKDELKNLLIYSLTSGNYKG